MGDKLSHWNGGEFTFQEDAVHGKKRKKAKKGKTKQELLKPNFNGFP